MMSAIESGSASVYGVLSMLNVAVSTAALTIFFEVLKYVNFMSKVLFVLLTCMSSIVQGI